jgi:hypothetical protein
MVVGAATMVGGDPPWGVRSVGTSEQARYCEDQDDKYGEDEEVCRVHIVTVLCVQVPRPPVLWALRGMVRVPPSGCFAMDVSSW